MSMVLPEFPAAPVADCVDAAPLTADAVSGLAVAPVVDALWLLTVEGALAWW